MSLIPTSLYIHVPWCIKKCPYCDFNSHPKMGPLPEEAYVAALLQDFKSTVPLLEPNTKLKSIFIGGGTPSLLSPKAYAQLFKGLQSLLPFDSNIETTLEANPESVELNRFKEYKQIGINRISVGVQSFNDELLIKLGRAHNASKAKLAIEAILQSGFDNFNIDLMFGLPSQSVEQALYDLNQAFKLKPAHLSWYQLTLEPNTPFYQKPPVLPHEDTLWDMQSEGQALLNSMGFEQYEISAYAKKQPCEHNLNYWQFGDYIGIGCGAHGKLKFNRITKIRHPKAYLQAYEEQKNLYSSCEVINTKELPFEFMLNALRLTHGFSEDLFTQRTHLPLESIEAALEKAQRQGLIERTVKTIEHPLGSKKSQNLWGLQLNGTNQAHPTKNNIIRPTPRGLRFLNDLVTLFL